MERILIVGRSGSGKSTLARLLGERLNLPVAHLDRHYWSAGWRPAPPAQFAQAVAGLAARDRWVIEGNYSATMPARIARADTVLVLHRARGLCLLSVTARALWHHGQVRADMADGCPERFDPAFLRFVWQWRPDRVLAALQPFAGTRIDLHGRTAINRYVESLADRERAPVLA